MSDRRSGSSTDSGKSSLTAVVRIAAAMPPGRNLVVLLCLLGGGAAGVAGALVSLRRDAMRAGTVSGMAVSRLLPRSDHGFVSGVGSEYAGGCR